MNFVEIGTIHDLKSGEMKMVKLEGKEILLARAGDEYYAADNRCPHMGGNLSLGQLDGTVITCPVHHSQFDLSNGQVVRWTDWSGIKLSLSKIFRSPRPLETYPVEVEGEKLIVNID